MTWCRDEDEHRRQAEDDYRRGGRYGYDREEYRNPWNDCSDAYTREFDRRIRDDERRQEERDEERRAEARAAERARERLEEEAYFQQAYEQQYPEQVYPEPEYPDEPASAPEGETR